MASLMPGDVDVLVVASHAPHLGGLRNLLGEDLAGIVRNVRVAGKAVGLGSVVAAASTARRIMQVNPRAVVLVGTANGYPGAGSCDGSVIVAERFLITCPANLDGRATFPEPMQTELGAPAALTTGLADTPGTGRGTVASSLARLTDASLGTRTWEGLGAHVENLEAFAVASACALLQVPFAAVLGVTGEVGTAARDHTMGRERAAADRACAVVAAWLERGAPGLPHGDAG